MSKLDALYAYQTAELKKEELEREVMNTPSRARLKKLHTFLKDQQNQLLRIQQDIVQREADTQKLQAQADKFAHDIDLERSEFENMLKDEEVTAAEITENRQNLEKILSRLNAAQREVTQALAGMEHSLREYTETRKKASAAKKEYDQLRVVCQEELDNSAPQRAQAQQAAEELAKSVDPALMEKYKRVKRNHAMPVAKVENNQCGGCNMSLPTVVVKRVASSTSIVECENCGRILYMEQRVEEEAPPAKKTKKKSE
ncbi:C4-type zinc ribbon domain-containing protein [Christensenellaceae bacterium OttesenSCG-928-L17]|nr:C4-type zinc ribbon domain-containing protein [Christensenellaceae bacterium OttesenSCG-928-L17]